MRQIETESRTTAVKSAPAKARKANDAPSLRQVLIILGGTGAIASAIGLLPHFSN